MPVPTLGILLRPFSTETWRHHEHCKERVPRDEHEVCEGQFVAHEPLLGGAREVFVDYGEDAVDFGGVAGLR